MVKKKKEVTEKLSYEEVYAKVKEWADDWKDPVHMAMIMGEIKTIAENSYLNTAEIKQLLNAELKLREKAEKTDSVSSIEEPKEENINPSNIDLRVEQFKKFYALLMQNAPEDYKPWFFPCEKNGKNPCSEAIKRLDKDNIKASWKHESARLDYEEVIEHIKQGYNIGISARTGDCLIIGDIDNPIYLNQMPKDTLTTKSRKRIGGHFFGLNKDNSAKINLPTNDGEIRSNDQYVLCVGSYVPFDLESRKDKKAYEELSEEAKKDSLLGYYTIQTESPLRELEFGDLPEFFRSHYKTESEKQGVLKLQIENNQKEYKEFKGEGKYSALLQLKVSDIVGSLPETKRVGHPLHESDTDANFSLSKDGTLGFCWRHLVSLNAVQFLCIKAGYCSCIDSGTPFAEWENGQKIRKRGYSKLRGDKKALEIAYNEAISLGIIREYKPTKEQQEKNILDRLSEIPEENVENAKISGKLKDGTFYWTIFVQYNKRYYPIVLTENKETLIVIDNYLERTKDKQKRYSEAQSKEERQEIQGELIPEEERYFFFEYKGITYRYTKELYFRQDLGINIPSKRIFNLLKEKIDKKKLYEDTIEQTKAYYDHSNENQYSLVFPAIILSYILWGLGNTFYLVIRGKEDTGKSTLQKFLRYVQMCGYFSGKSSIPVTTRLLHFFGIAMNQDEIEKVGKDERQIFVGVANSGLDINGTYCFVNSNKKNIKDQIVILNTFGFKSFSANSEILDQDFDKSFISRCYEIIATRTNRKTLDIKNPSQEQKEVLQELTDRLFVYCLTHFSEIEQSIKEVKEELEKEGKFGRKNDIYSIILGILKHFKGDYTQEKQELESAEGLERMESSNTKDSLTFNYIATKFLKKESESLESIELTNSELRDFLNEELNLPEDKKIHSRTIGAILRNYNLLPRPENIKREGKGFKYVIDLNTFKNMLDRFRYTEISNLVKDIKISEMKSSLKPSSFSSFNSFNSQANEDNELNELNEDNSQVLSDSEINFEDTLNE